MLKNAENIALQNLPILYAFVLQAEIVFCITNFRSQILQGYIFRIFQHFASKFCNFTIFDMLFSAVVMNFVFHVLMKI